MANKKDQHNNPTADSLIEQKPKEIPDVIKDWNQKTSESYTKKGFEIPDRLDEEQRRFLKDVDTENFPVEKEVTHIFRIKAKDYSSKRQELKEYVYWWENWHGKDYLGRKVAPVASHVESKYMKQESEQVFERRQKLIGHNRSGQHEVHYVPFSKKTVDDIISRSTMDNKHEIKFYVKFPDGLRNGDYSYDQFTNFI
ncbi:MAG: hypothetical protein MRJ93_15150 [Nitrososphaeraceae archaeon]|nr:hypothetical protein [Nitrososphaeraceae archaeon]